NSKFDTGEAQAGATVTLYKLLTPGGAVDPGFVPQVSGPTLADGGYLFTGLNAGSYRLIETPPVGYGNAGTQTNLSQLNQGNGSAPSRIDVTIGNPDTVPPWTVNLPDFHQDGVYFHGNGMELGGYVGQSIVNVTETDIGYNTGDFSTYCVDLNRDIFH